MPVGQEKSQDAKTAQSTDLCKSCVLKREKNLFLPARLGGPQLSLSCDVDNDIVEHYDDGDGDGSKRDYNDEDVDCDITYYTNSTRSSTCSAGPATPAGQATPGAPAATTAPATATAPTALAQAAKAAPTPTASRTPTPAAPTIPTAPPSAPTASPDCCCDA